MIVAIRPTTADNMAPLTGPVAPDQPETVVAQGRRTGYHGPDIVVNREPVEPVVRVPLMTVSAGEQIGRIPRIFDVPNPLWKRLGQRWRSGMRTTLLAPELQSEIGADAGVFPRKGMNYPYTVVEPEPWYTTFSREIG